ncbi:uncharacterized protein BDR25DRAFT_302281 [Lindgomyces ingoldianus]|uniref:Uncharacterized protein n=1 Tax=Lindgomyces ingoldianus TaxID=673940 RepID=A0ACB6R241_9PLEO|nr:uncharacterized protein BDR25DRAFT_302281 [Lindgomyces ingoldianus]KAF2473343.1 hypothetical protein BDR25DRAFT_302281 [Lindgomyces ingoldianus]
MDETKLRQLERQYKLRVKTGCETCRIRRVKCDETKPECQRCTKTGRKCEGYKHVTRSRDQSPAAAASFRNPSFLVVPQKPSPTSVPRNPSRSISPDSAENRSFFYFRTHTLPKWTEFFDSDLWSQKILQLSQSEPAIKHGILALSTMHERFESTTPIFSAKTNDFAFVQYMQAVKHSNDLLTAHQEGKVDVEKVLIACIIFTCYENLAGNYRAANMHLRNGLRILNQHKRDLPPQTHSTAAQESIANVLYRFDLQAMTFSDNTSPYDYSIDNPPECPQIPDAYTKNANARNDLVGLLRCMMWISGVANINPQAPEHPTWLRVYTKLMSSFETWRTTFDKYQQNIPPSEQGDPKIYAGNTLLKIYGMMASTIVAAGAGLKTEMAWDSFVDSFKTVVDLAETLPILNRPASQPSSRSSTSPPRSTPTSSKPRPAKLRVIAPNPATTTPSPPPGTSTLVFLPDPAPPVPATKTACEFTTTPVAKRSPSSFSPSFELSPIVPLFITACRCRDPVLRRRAIALLLNCRRREGVWDSFGAGMVALQCVKLEEGLDEVFDLGPENWLPLGRCSAGDDIAEPRRVQDVFVSVNMAERHIAVNYLMRSGESIDRYVEF